MARKIGKFLGWFIAIASTFSIIGASVAFRIIKDMDISVEWPDYDDEA